MAIELWEKKMKIKVPAVTRAFIIYLVSHSLASRPGHGGTVNFQTTFCKVIKPMLLKVSRISKARDRSLSQEAKILVVEGFLIPNSDLLCFLQPL